MSLSANLMPEIEQEFGRTRKLLESVPDGNLDWRPHQKSMTLGRLASHIAELPLWGTHTLTMDELDVAPVGKPPVLGANLGSRREILALFDGNAAELLRILPTVKDGDFGRPWTLKRAGKPLFSMPKTAVFRSSVLNHLIHHRAQLGVYFRLKDIPLPPTYGPSADDAGIFA